MPQEFVAFFLVVLIILHHVGLYLSSALGVSAPTLQFIWFNSTNHEEVFVLRAAILFFVLALVAMIFGATGFAGLSMDIGKTLVTIFLVLAVLSFLANILLGRNAKVLR